MIKIAL